MALTRRGFIAGMGASALFSGLAGTDALGLLSRKKLNVLFIMTDDHAAHAIGTYGSRINRIPNMDALARGGMMFDSCICTNPICTPSRGGILTGEYSHKNGVPVFNDISPDKKTVGGYMRDAGYYTAFIGKWHLGGPGTMRDQDWDKWMIYGGQGQYFDPWFYERDGAGNVVQTRYPGEYATENITRMTCATIDKSVEAGKPFFVMMHHKAPHRNWLPSKKYRDRFRKLTLKDIPIPATLFDDWQGRATPIRTTAMTLLKHMRPGLDLKLAEYFREGNTFEFEGRKYEGAKDAQGEYIDAWPEGMDNRAKTALSYLRYMQDYLACVQSVDDSVGDMVAYLKAKGLYENTVVFYTSDQGFFLGDHGLYDKRFIMEETLKMPLIVHCPALIKPGSVNSELVSNVDFAETFLDIAGACAPECMQGKSFLPLLEGSRLEHRDACYARYYVEGGEHATAAWYGLRTKTDKLCYYYKRGEWEYFDLVKDPEELHNGYGDEEYQTRIEALKERLEALRQELGDTDQFQNAQEYSL